MPVPAPATTRSKQRPGDRIFASTTVIAGSVILTILAAVTLFLVLQSIPAFLAQPSEIKGAPSSFWVYVGPFVFGTLWSSLLALIIAVPLSLCIALFISHYAPRRLARLLGNVVDLLAAVPSVVFGLWGILILAPALQPFYVTLVDWFGWFPLFAPPVSGTGRTILTVAIVLAVMVLPIITAVCREVFLQTPRLHEEAALALGATRWELIRIAVLPFGRSGVISASILGLGRALGETMAVAMVLSPATVISFVLTSSTNPNTIAANIALNFPEAHGIGVNVLLATGLILFIITFAVNFLARMVIARRKNFSGAN
jgi:phosphate transport system permease protein